MPKPKDKGWLWEVTYNNAKRAGKSDSKAKQEADQAEKWRRYGKPFIT